MNLLTKVTSWQLLNSSVSGDNITFTAAGYAIGVIPIIELAGLVDDFEFSGTCIPPQSGYNSILTLAIRIQYTDLSIQSQTLFLSNNRGSYCRIPFSMTIEDILSCSILVYATEACQVIGAYLENRVASLDGLIAGLQKELPRVLLDFNEYDIELMPYEEEMVAMITCRVHKLTDINGHFACNYFASEATIILVRFYDAQAECLFSPIVYSVAPGDGCLGIPHVYPKVKDGFHNFMVTVTAASGEVYIDTRSVQYSIDGNGLTEGLQNAPARLSDITAYTDENGNLKGIYAVSLISGTANIRHADYHEDESMNWITDFSIEDVEDVAIEFDGNWFEAEIGRRLLTDPLPVVGYIEKEEPNTLYIQVFDDFENRIEVAQNVLQVELLRAWKYIDEHTHNDMGFIIAYIKDDGKVYYRSLVQNIDGLVAFEQEEEIVFTGAVPPYEHLSLNRLNDFRVEATIRDSLGNGFALLTPRYYQGDSVESYNISVGMSLTRCHLARPVYPEIDYAENTEKTKTSVYFNMKIDTPLEDVKAAFSIKDAATTYTIISSAPIFDQQDLDDLEGILDDEGLQLLPSSCIGIEFTHSQVMLTSNPGTLTFTNPSGNDMSGPLVATNDSSTFAVPSKTVNFEMQDYSIHAYGGALETDNVKVGVTFTIDLIGSIEYIAHHKNTISVAATPIIDNILTNTINVPKPTHNVGATVTPIIVLTQVGTSPL